MKVAILSDTHGYVYPDVLSVVADCDYAVHAGDIGSAETLDCLEPRRGMIAVRGNNDWEDFWLPGDRLRVANLPAVSSLDLPGGKLVVEHGHEHGFNRPDHASLRQAHAEARLIIYGHTHRQVIDTDETPWVANPGAAGRTRTHGGPGCLVLHIDQGTWDLERMRFNAVPIRVQEHDA